MNCDCEYSSYLVRCKSLAPHMTFRLTKKRQQILDSLKKSGNVMTAKDVHHTLPDIDLVTIYRALDVLVKEKLITQVNLGGGEAQYEYQSEPHKFLSFFEFMASLSQSKKIVRKHSVKFPQSTKKLT